MRFDKEFSDNVRSKVVSILESLKDSEYFEIRMIIKALENEVALAECRESEGKLKQLNDLAFGGNSGANIEKFFPIWKEGPLNVPKPEPRAQDKWILEVTSD